MIGLDSIYEIPALVGSIFFITGIIMQIFPPKKINSLYGYRTNNSMKNQTNWDFAQRYSTKLLAIIGAFLILISLLKNWLQIHEDLEKGISVFLVIGSVIFLIIKTEKKLNKL